MKITSAKSLLLGLTVAVATGVAQTNTFPSSGSTGIGTLAPAAKLEIDSTGTGGGTLIFGGVIGSKNGGHELALVGGAPVDGAYTSQPGGQIRLGGNARGDDMINGIQFLQNGREILRVNNGGNVGVGNSAPQASLDLGSISRPSNYHYSLFWYNDSNTGPYFGTKGGIYLDQWGLANNTTVSFPTASANPGTLIFASKDTTVNDASSLTPRFTIAGQTGNVGIGTTNPSEIVHIKRDSGNGGTNIIVEHSGVGSDYRNGSAAIVFGKFDGTQIRHQLIYYKIVGPGWADSRTTITSFLSSGSTDDTINITAGNVGIGTTNPTQRLAVNGTIRAKEVIVDTGWSDYVFASDYALAPLSEVEAHIKAEKHLPGIPSASEVAEHGISVGEMQAKLLAKIEELTLHVIEQQKLLANQSQQLAKQSDLVRDQAARLERLEQHSASTTPSTY